MTFLNGITILLIYQLIGEVSVRLLNLPIPGPVMGMILLFITLLIRGGANEPLNSASTALLSHLSLLFVPAGVGLMVHFELIAKQWLAISLTLILSTIITIMGSAAIMQLVNKLMHKNPAGPNNDFNKK